VHTEFWWGILRERDHLEFSGIDGRIILRWIFRKWDEGMDRMDLAQDRDRRRKPVNVKMKIMRIKPTSANRVCESINSNLFCHRVFTATECQPNCS
jgi:hypothetical protein